jgi:hypothetical protein
MKTIKLLSFFIVAAVIFSSCDAIVEKTSKTVETVETISFTTTDASLVPQDKQNVKNALSKLYEDESSRSKIEDQLKKYGLNIKNISDLEVTKVTATFESLADAKLFNNLEFRIQNRTIAKQTAIATTTSIDLSLADYIVDRKETWKVYMDVWLSGENVLISIYNDGIVPKGIKVKLAYTVKGTVSPLYNYSTK